MSALNKELNQAEQVLQRLGNFAALMDCMIVQNFVTISHSEIMTFHNKILKVNYVILAVCELLNEH